MAIERSRIFCRHSHECGHPACGTRAKRHFRRFARFMYWIPAFARMTASGECHAYFERTKLEPAMHENDGHRRHITCQIRK